LDKVRFQTPLASFDLRHGWLRLLAIRCLG